jgi:O-antigen/teichoic acid export membrane protein
MGEYLGRGDRATAREIFFLTLRLQIIFAIAVTAIAMAVIYVTIDRSKLAFSMTLAAILLPTMINCIPAQANAATEDFGANVPASLAASFVYTAGVVLVLYFGWELTGLAVVVFAMKWADVVIRSVPVVRRFRRCPRGALTRALRSRIFVFSRQNVTLLFLSTIVWDRSEMLFLQSYSGARQLAFYSVVFNITERLRSLPAAFGSVLSPTIMAQFGRDPAKLNAMASSAIRYLGLVVLPVNLGIAMLSAPLIALLYGSKYLSVIPLLAIAVLLAIPKALLSPLEALMGATENQHLIVRWTVVVAIVNVSLDLLLIPTRAAMGAVVANGVSQLLITVILFTHAVRIFHIPLPVLDLAKIVVSASAMAFAIWLTGSLGLSPIAAIVVGTVVGTAVFLFMLRATQSLDRKDLDRMHQIEGSIPYGLGSWLSWGVSRLVPASRA